jgi:protein tyrosine/serine phosphatase
MQSSRKKLIIVILAALALAAGAFGAYHFFRGRSLMLNDAVVEPGKLIRSAQPLPGDLADLQAQFGIATILSLSGKEPYDVSLWVRQHNVRVIILTMRADDPPTPDQAALFFDLMRGDTITSTAYGEAVYRVIGSDPNTPTRFPFPVLIHCQGGADRTGVMVALYRLAFQHWTLDQAKTEMQHHRHIPAAHPDQFKFLESVAPTLTPFTYSKTHPPTP